MKTTLQEYKKYKRIDKTLSIGKYIAPFVPVIVTTGINWNEWFGKQGTSLPFGLATMLIGILSALFSYSKIKNEETHRVSPFFYIGATLAIFGVSFLLLANILGEMGLMFLFVVSGILAGGTMDQIDNDVIKNRVSEYKDLVDNNKLDLRQRKKEMKKEQRRLKAEKEAQEIKDAQERAVE